MISEHPIINPSLTELYVSHATFWHAVIDRVVCLCLSIGLSVTLVSPAKTAESIEMPFELRTRVGPRNHVLDGGPQPPWEGAILGRGVAL